MNAKMQSHKKTSFLPVCYARAHKSLLQRRCACGNHTIACGECEECGKRRRFGLQTKLKVNEPGDIYEQEADRIADQVLTAPRHFAVSGAPPLIRRFSKQSSRLNAAPASVDQVLANPGKPLEPPLRNEMEQSFGHDFSRVRVHTGPAAEQSAQHVNAHAYTVGNDIVFGTGRFAPGNGEGQHLLAHELAHVVQQAGGLRRMTLGKGKGPDGALEVPDKEKDRVLAAIGRVRKVVEDPKGYSNCHRTFAETCPGGGASSLKDAFNKATLWRSLPDQRLGAGASTLCGTGNVIYTIKGYGGGEASLAFDLLHELGHVCGIACPDTPHYLADKLALYCMGPLESDENSQLTLRFGRSTEDWALILSYGWALHECGAGRLTLGMKADLNLLGALQGLKELAGERAPGGEIGGVTFGLHVRPFSGEHFGGLSFHAGMGGQFGRFRIRPPNAGDPADIRTDAALVIETGSRIEWWVKNEAMTTAEGEVGRVKPRAFDLSYRLFQPVTSGAKRAHEFLASYVYYF